MTITMDNPMGYSLLSISGASGSILQFATEEDWIVVDEHTIRIPLENQVGSYVVSLTSYSFAIDDVGTDRQTLEAELDAKYFVCLAQEGVVEIRTKEDLKAMDGWRHYKLMNDIDLSDSIWSGHNRMRGYFDGNGHTISGMHSVNGEGDLGLFDSAVGHIKNLSLTEIYIRATNVQSYGALCENGAFFQNDMQQLRIENVSVEQDVELTTEGYSGVALLVGMDAFYATTCENCTASGRVLKDGVLVELLLSTEG